MNSASDLQLWNDLAALEPSSVAQRTGARVSGNGIYDIAIFNRNYTIAVAAKTIAQSGAMPEAVRDFRLELPLLKYMTDAQNRAPAGEWVSPRDLPGGAQFFTGVHAVPVGKIISIFGESKERFSAACTALGGSPVPFGDAGFELRLFPRLPVQVLLWLGDEEFPARAAMLVDRNAHRHMPLDALLLALGYVQYALVVASPTGNTHEEK